MTQAPTPGARTLRVPGTTWQSVARRLDGLLFQPGGWFTIDAGNTKVASEGSLKAALAALEAGRAASVVGRLRRDVAGVDVDAGGTEGDAIADQVAAWATAHGHPHLVRPSGGGTGRWHVYVVLPAESQRADLRRELATLRATYGLSGVQLELKQTLRPLSAPHRRGGHPKPLGTVAELLDTYHLVRDQLPARPRRAASGPTARRRRAEKAVARTSTSSRADLAGVALVPLPRRRQPLPSHWRDWLDGTGPTPTIRGGDQTRSAIELVATATMMRTGLTAGEAWRLIADAQGQAMARTLARGRGWWVEYAWNPAVSTDTAFRSTTAAAATPGRTTPCGRVPASEDTQRAVDAARAALGSLQWQLGHRRRHGVLLVAHLLLDRMLRTDLLRVPCPIRDLEQDTGLSKTTLVAALRELDGRLGRRLALSDHQHRATTSHEFELDERFSSPTLVLLHGTPGLTPPPPQPGLWASLRPLAHTVWRHLPPPEPTPAAEAEPAASLETLSRLAGLTHDQASSPTTQQQRTLKGALKELEDAGLAQCTSNGTWVQSWKLEPAHVARAAAVHEDRAERIERERALWRSSATTWQRTKIEALRRTEDRQATWWSSLPAATQETRQKRQRAAYAALPLYDKLARKQLLARRRAEAGGPSERERHADWCRQHSRAEQAEISARWQHHFQTLDWEEQRVLVDTLREYRERWQLPLDGGWVTSTAPATGHGASA